MSIGFPSATSAPSGLTALPSGVKRPAFGTLYGFDASGGAWNGNEHSLTFDGTNDFVVIPPVAASAQQGTISAWIKTSSTSNSIVFTQTDVTDTTSSTWAFVSILGTGEPRFGWRGGALDLLIKRGTTQINDGAWHHVAWTCDGSLWKIYVDGVDEGTLTTVSGSASDGNWFGDLGSINVCRIGCQERYLGRDTFFDGAIDELAIWDSALSASDVTDIYNSGVPGDLRSYSPVGWWRMGDNDGATGTTITDQGSGGNDGTLINGPTFSTDIPA